MDDFSTLEMVKKWYRAASSQTSDWRKEAEEAYDLVSGDQWTEEDKQILKDQDRPPVTFNRIGPVIDSISGMEVNNRQQVRFIPRSSEDGAVNEVLSLIADWARDNCSAEDEESEAFRDCLIPGIGWTETRIDYVRNPDGEIVIERVDPLEMFWDAAAKNRNLSDSSYFMRVRDIDIEDARAMFPDAEDGDLNAAWATLDEADKLKRGSDPDGYEEEEDAKIQKTGKVRIVECQWRESEGYHRAANPDSGEIEELSEDQYKTLKKRKKSIKAVKQYRKVMKRAFVGRIVLEEGPLDTGGFFTWHCITGKRDRNNNSWYGVIRGMKDPQQYANKWLSQSLHIFNTNAKGGVIAEKDAISSVRDFEESWASSDRVTWVNPGALAAGKIDKKPQAELPSQLDRMMQFAVDSIRDTSGVNLEMLGMADRAQAGVVESQRKQAAMTVLAPMFDSLRRYRKQQSRLMLHYIQNFLSDGRKVRIAGPDYVGVVNMTSDVTAGEYDVVIDQAPSSANQKEETWGILSQMMPVMIKMGIPMKVWMEMLKASPLPSAIVAKITGEMEKEMAKPKPPPPEIQKAQMDMQIRQQESQMDMQQAQQKMQMEAAQAQQKIQMDMQTQQQQAEFDMQAEMRKAQMDMQIMMEKNSAAIQVAREKAQVEMEIAIAKANNEIMLKREAATLEADHEERKKRIEMGDFSPSEPPEPDERVDILLQSMQEVSQTMQQMIALLQAPKMLVRDPASGKILGAKVVLN